MKAKILIVDDDQNFLTLTRALLEQEGYEIDAEREVDRALAWVREKSYDLIIVDLRMPDINGFEFMEECKKIDPGLVVLLVSGHGTIKDAVYAMSLGAFDFIEKSWDPESRELQIRIEKGLQKRRQDLEIKQLKEDESDRAKMVELIGSHPKMQKVFNSIQKVSETDVTVLIEGETGTGKELVAKAIHAASFRRDKPLIVVNCPAYSASLLESELFGHERGAYTGALTRRLGRFEMGDGGTVFLDEVGDIPMETQTKLLRVLQQRQVERVGGSQIIDVNVRIVAATNRNLENMVQQGKFREDLYFRLKGFQIYVPPLRERGSDIELLARHFIQIYNRKLNKTIQSISSELLDQIKIHEWRGNIRELMQAIEVGVLMEDSSELKHLEFSGKIVIKNEFDHSSIDLDMPYKQALSNWEKKYFFHALKACSGNITKAAQKVGISAKTVQRKLKDHGLMKGYSDPL